MTGLSTCEACIVAHLHTRQSDMVQAVTAWSSINSGSPNLAGLAVMRDLLVERLILLGGSIAIHEPDPVTSFDATTGAEIPLAHGSNIHVCKRPGALRRVLLTGHMDTVFTADHAFQTPRRVDDTILIGPGVADMKGGILVLLEALAALEEAGAIGDIGWDIIINADEEVSSAGSRSLLRRVARTAQ